MQLSRHSTSIHPYSFFLWLRSSMKSKNKLGLTHPHIAHINYLYHRSRLEWRLAREHKSPLKAGKKACLLAGSLKHISYFRGKASGSQPKDFSEWQSSWWFAWHRLPQCNLKVDTLVWCLSKHVILPGNAFIPEYIYETYLPQFLVKLCPGGWVGRRRLLYMIIVKSDAQVCHALHDYLLPCAFFRITAWTWNRLNCNYVSWIYIKSAITLMCGIWFEGVMKSHHRWRTVSICGVIKPKSLLMTLRRVSTPVRVRILYQHRLIQCLDVCFFFSFI